MAKPIKERGIKWTESYGDKSSYLKREMDEQIGLGSYFRWEGHDSTTGNDYYVVVSPGWSPKKGYHFFAGLRKMPADHGASGKYFNSMREALNYAYETWRVPKPDTMPAPWSAPTVDSIKGKDIVMEGRQSEASSDKQTKVSWLSPEPKKKDTKLGMSMRSMQEQFNMQVGGPRILKEHYCWAYAASPVMGFLPALYSRFRIQGVDGQNFNPNAAPRTYNLFGAAGPGDVVPDESRPRDMQKYGRPIPGVDPERADERPPLMATCQEPDEEEFARHSSGSLVTERLYSIPKSMGGEGGGKYPIFKQPYPAKPGDENFSVSRWSDKPLKVKVEIPSGTIGIAERDQFIEKWNDLFLREYREALADKYRKAVAEPAAPEEAERARAMLDEALGMDRILVEEDEASGVPEGRRKPVDADQVYHLTLMVQSAPALDRFSGIIAKRTKALKGASHVTRVIPDNTVTKNFLKLYNRSREIWASGNQSDIDKYGIAEQFDFDQPYEQTIKLSEGQLLVYDDLGMPRAMAVDHSANEGWQMEEKREELKLRYVLKDPVAFVERNEPGFAQAWSAWQEGDKRALPQVKRALDSFRAKAAANALAKGDDGRSISVRDVYDSRTVAPLLTNPKADLPKTDQNKLPVTDDGSPVSPGFTEGMGDEVLTQDLFHREVSDMVRPYTVEATSEAVGEGPAKGSSVWAARYYDPKRGDYVYGPMEQAVPGSSPRQELSGVPTMTRKASMAVAEPGGGTYGIARNEFVLYDPESRGQFIPGNLFDLEMAPLGVSSQGQHRKNAGLNDGFHIKYWMHKAKWDSGKGHSTARRQNPDEFVEAVPPGMEQYAGTAKGKVVFYDSGKAMEFLRNELRLPKSATEPFTPLTVMDLKVINQKAQEGREFYERNRERFEAGEIPPGTPEHEQCRYGKAVSECGGFKYMPKEILEEIDKAKADPESAMRPKEGQLWGMWVQPPEGSGEDPFWYSDPKLGTFLAPSKDKALEDTRMAGPQRYVKQGYGIQVSVYSPEGPRDPSRMGPALPRMALATEATSYVEGAEAVVDDLETGHLSPEEAAALREQVATPEEAEQAEEAEQFAAEPETPQAPAPEAPVEAPRTQRMAPEKEWEPDMPFGEEFEEITPEEAPKSRFVEKYRDPGWSPQELVSRAEGLAKLADRYDREGRRAEADMADRAIEYLARLGKKKDA